MGGAALTGVAHPIRLVRLPRRLVWVTRWDAPWKEPWSRTGEYLRCGGLQARQRTAVGLVDFDGLASISSPRSRVLTGRRVNAFLSDNHIDPDVAIEAFQLAFAEMSDAGVTEVRR
jgi:hypothetical protein